MGNWNINIQGIGCHHNENLPQDANQMAMNFVDSLVAAGHTIQHATFTHGGMDSLRNRGIPDPVPCDDLLGKVAYDAYCETRGWKSFNNEPLPQWGDVRPDIKSGWIIAAKAVTRAV
jgi:hypothetical protein